MSAAAVATSSSTATLTENTRSASSGNDTTINDNFNGTVNGKHMMETEVDQSRHQRELQQSPLQQAQQQLREQEEARLSDAAAVESETAASNPAENNPLPSDLRRILSDVARTGTCSWLSWNQASRLPEGMSGASSLRTITSSHLVGSPHAGLAPSSMNAAGAAIVAPGAAASASRQPFASHRRSPYPAGAGQQPQRKKHRNGLHKSSRRRFVADGIAATGAAVSGTAGRKRPLFLIRTTSANATAGAAAPGSTYSAGSVGSGRTSGSEPDDSTQYECDSDTTNSEISFERRDQHLARQHQRVNSNAVHASKLGASATPGEEDDMVVSSEYTTLQEAFCVALGLVLDHFYRYRGGYKLSPAERRRNETLHANSNSGSQSDKTNSEEPTTNAPLSPETIFQQRRQRLVRMLLPSPSSEKESVEMQSQQSPNNDGPPFTIQRIAEVLVAPERYYTQAHKLCNCLEKLLLVSSSTDAFGGSTGGDTSQSRREERELAALEDEKERQKTELRQRRLRRRQASPTDELMGEGGSDGVSRNQGGSSTNDAGYNRKSSSPDQKGDAFDGGNQGSPSKSRGNGGVSDSSAQELLEAAARASLRTKFDHVGIDPHSPGSHGDRDVRHIAESRGMTNSPPPPSLAMASASNMALPGHGGVSGFVRQHSDHPTHSDHSQLGRVQSPILFPPGSESALHATTNMHMLQLHHAAALAGVSIGHSTNSPLDLGSLGGAAEDLEVEHASNSDADSESDDVSLDDSASDRSDGSDSGSATHHEPFTAARAMALNRMQQQQRLQSRALTSLNSLNRSSDGFRPPADSEYQSGDSMDSTRAEDSGGSDSSSSDLAD